MVTLYTSRSSSPLKRVCMKESLYFSRVRCRNTGSNGRLFSSQHTTRADVEADTLAQSGSVQRGYSSS
jgi:hypothetical protein